MNNNKIDVNAFEYAIGAQDVEFMKSHYYDDAWLNYEWLKAQQKRANIPSIISSLVNDEGGWLADLFTE